jgi:small subunit ribosomal protein S7
MLVKNLVFGEWSCEGIEVRDAGLRPYITLESKITTFSQGRHAKKAFYKSRVHIVERLINNLMRSGTGDKVGGRVIRDRGGCGKKTKMYIVARKAFKLVNQKTGKNPVELLIRAIENAAPHEETTRVRYGGVIYHLAVDVSPQRRLDFALRNIGRAVAIRSFDNPKSAETALAEEIVLASQNDAQSHAIARKIEIERVAKSSR